MTTEYDSNALPVTNFTSSAETTLRQEITDYSKFLPVVNRSESITRFFSATVNQLLSSGSTQSISAYWGRLSGRNYNSEIDLFNAETDATRLNYQFQPGVLSKSGESATQTVSYINWLKRLESIGADVNNHDRLFSEPGYVLDVPINIDMFVNYRNYYWLEGNIPVIEIEAVATAPIDIDQIVKRSRYITPALANYKTVDFVTGLRVKFVGDNVTSSSGQFDVGTIYYVENVGGLGGIQLVETITSSGEDRFPAITPYYIQSPEGWDTVDWDVTPWDGVASFTEYDVETTLTRNDLSLNKSYLVMQRWARDKNPWARSNQWFSSQAITIAAEYNDLDAIAYLNDRTRAARPIIEFRANMELYNFKKTFAELVNYVIDLSQVETLLSGVEHFLVDPENALQDGDIILVAKNQGELDIEGITPSGPLDPVGYFAKSYVVSGVGSEITLTLRRTYVDNEYVIVSSGTEKGTIYGYKNFRWELMQNKNSRGTSPLFNLYDDECVALSEYADDNFFGDKIFAYKVNEAGAYDRELDLSPVINDTDQFNNYAFEWTISNNRYNQNITVENSEEISGYYYWYDWVQENHLNGWTNIRGGQRVPIIQTVKCDGINYATFNLGTDKYELSKTFSVSFQSGNYRWNEISYIDQIDVGSYNPEFVWMYDTDYSIQNLISDSSHQIEFVDPYGNTDSNIIVTTLNGVITLRINSAYPYEKIIYRDIADQDNFGEIHLSNANQNRIRILHNGRILRPSVDYTLSGNVVTLTNVYNVNDVIELFYVADADLTNIVYDVAPVHFYNNTNKPFTVAGYDDLIQHFTRQLSAMPGFVGEAFNNNNYSTILPITAYDGLIRQQRYRTTHIQYLLDQENINPIKALKTFAKDYSDFKKHFANKVKQLWTTERWNTVYELVDRAIADINIGKGNEFKYAKSDMAYINPAKTKKYIVNDNTTTFALPDVINTYGDVRNHIQIFVTEWHTATQLYLTRPLINNVDYTLSGLNVILTVPVLLPTNPLTSKSQVTIRWFDNRQTSHIPFSTVKLGFFKPTQVEVLNGVLHGHDGSSYTLASANISDMNGANFDVVGAALLDYELRVFNNLSPRHFIDDVMMSDMRLFYPNANHKLSYGITDINVRMDDWFNRWAIAGNKTTDEAFVYSALNEFTWNYSSVAPYLGGWRNIYTYYFRTIRPHSHPWEMLGHHTKPVWWDTHYSWTAGARRTALIKALKYGITGNAAGPDYIDTNYAINKYDWDNDVLVTSNGSATLNGPVTAGVVTAPASIKASELLVTGDWGDNENVWRQSSEYLFALVEVILQLKPYRAYETFWMLNNWVLNKGVSQEQFIDRNTRQRIITKEIHGQKITSGVLTKIIVENGGSGFTDITLTFDAKQNNYETAKATGYISSGSVTNVAVDNPGRGYNATPVVAITGTPGFAGLELKYLVDFAYINISLGFNTLSAEEYRSIQDDTTALSELLSSLSVNYMLHVGGFTDKRLLNIEVDGVNGAVRIPETNYSILTDKNAPNQTVFYSGVKISKIDGAGYKVEGYNLDSTFFAFMQPSTGGKQVSIDVGNTTLIKHLVWKNDLAKVTYGTIFSKRQSLYQFLLGLGKYYEALGFDGYTVWEANAIDTIKWTLSDQTDPYYVNGIVDALIFKQLTTGITDVVDVSFNGFSNIIDKNFKPIRRNELLVLRDDVITEYSLKNSENKIYGLGISVSDYEHIITIDETFEPRSIVYRPELGVGQNRIRISGERTRNWNGKIEAPGYLVRGSGLMLNLESSVRELERDWVSSETKALERLTRQTLGFNVGYSKPTYLSNTFVGDSSAYQFEKGYRKYKGTASAITAMSRNKNIFGEEFDYQIQEEWMVRLGDYGDVSERMPLQFAVDPTKIKSDPQQFRFHDYFTSDRTDDLIIDLHKGAVDSISGNYDRPFDVYDVLRIDNNSIQTLEQYQTFTRDAGLPLVTEIDYSLLSIDQIGEVYDPTQEYALIPNWSETSAYVQGDLVRRYGHVYRLLIGSTGLTNVRDDIVVRGSQVFPEIVSGSTFVVNSQTITFNKSVSQITYEPIVVTGSVDNPVIPSGSTLTIDGVNVNFIKTQTSVNYDDIVIAGNVINPSIVNSASNTLTIGYANNLTSPFTIIPVNFNELDPTLSMQTIWNNALTAASATDPLATTNNRIAALNALRTAYIAANSVSAWQIFFDNYYADTSSPHNYVNPLYLGSQILANLGATWEIAARALLDLDLALISNIGGAHSETQVSIVSGLLVNSTTFNIALNAANSKLDFTVLATNINKNLQDYRNYVIANGSVTLAAGLPITVTHPTNYVVDNLSEIAAKITSALFDAGVSSDITVSTTGGVLTITRTNNLQGYRLGVSVNTNIGFTTADGNVIAQGSTLTGPISLTLSEAVQSINNASITGVAAQVFEQSLRLVSNNQALIISNSTAISLFGLNVGNYSAITSTSVTTVNLSINDVVTQINTANILNLAASQISGVLVLTYTGDVLVIGNGSANESLGIQANTYESFTNQIQNVFNTSDWEIIQDPAHFNVWTIDNVGSNPSAPATTTNLYNVYQTLDFGIGITEICAGEERGDDALVKVDRPHTLEVGDRVLLINTTCVPSADGIHEVISVMNDLVFFIDYFIQEKGFTGKVIPLRSVRFPNNNVAVAALGLDKYVQGNYGLRSDDYVYVDQELDGDGESLGHGAVYVVKRTADGPGLFKVREETGKTNNHTIRNGKLKNVKDGSTIITYEVFDPLKGIIPGIAASEIDLRSDVDFAYYNNSTDPDFDVSQNAWGQERVNMVWWDLSKAVYINYDQGTADYRQSNWGKLFPSASIDIYEWTKSPVTPDQYTAITRSRTIIDGVELTGIPYAVIDRYGEEQYYWSEEVELNQNTNQLETYFYFWVKNKTTTPTVERNYSVKQLAEIIRNPNSQQIDWLAATSNNSLLISNLNKSLSQEQTIMTVNFDTDPSAYHQEFLLLPENDPNFIMPEWLHLSLRDSLSGYTQHQTVYPYRIWNSLISYFIGEVVKSSSGKFFKASRNSLNVNPDTLGGNNFWTQLDQIEINPDGDFNTENTVLINEPKNIPDLMLHPYIRQGIETRPHQTWFIDIDQARRAAVDKINDQLKNINLVDSSIPWRAEFDRTITSGDMTYDITDYWNYIDWSAATYRYDQGRCDFYIETVEELNLITPESGQLAHISNNIDPDGKIRIQVRQYDGAAWQLVFKENATIKFSDLLWDTQVNNYGWDVIGWDVSGWDLDSGVILVEIFNSFYYRLWTQSFSQRYVDLWLHMAKYVLQEQPSVDWIFKSSYFNLVSKNSLEKSYNKYLREQPEQFVDYVNNAKPFRSKLRMHVENKIADDLVPIELSDTLEFRVQTLPLLALNTDLDARAGQRIIDPFSRAFRLSVGIDGNNYSSQILDDRKLLLAANIKPDTQFIPYLVNRGNSLPSSGAIWINGERITYTDQTLSVTGGIGPGFSSGFSSGFSGVRILIGITRGTQGTLPRGHQYADIIEGEVALTEFNDLTDYGNNISTAWAAVNTGLFDQDNANVNGVFLRGSTLAITAITRANPAVVTVASTSNMATGMRVGIRNVVGMTQINDQSYQITVLTATTFALQDVNSTSFGTYVSGGTVDIGDKFGTIEPYGNILFAQWLALNEPAQAIGELQQQIEEFIELYWASI